MLRISSREYSKAQEVLYDVKINHLFAKTVLNEEVDGRVYVDSLENPKIYYVRHPYGMSLIFGEPEAFEAWDEFWKHLENYPKNHTKDEWLQVWPEEIWTALNRRMGFKADDHAIIEVGDTINKETRVNFEFDHSAYLASNARDQRELTFGKIVRTGVHEYNGLKGSVVANHFWRDREVFLKDGIGFSLVDDGNVASTAFSAFIHSGQLELGIETAENYRGKGCAFHVCCQLIDYCLDHNLKPVWSCRFGNTGSVKLAQKLKFKPSKYIPYYRLKGSESR